MVRVIQLVKGINNNDMFVMDGPHGIEWVEPDEIIEVLAKGKIEGALVEYELLSDVRLKSYFDALWNDVGTEFFMKEAFDSLFDKFQESCF